MPFTQWATAFADDQTLTAAMLDRLCITHTSCKSPARATGSRQAQGRANIHAGKHESSRVTQDRVGQIYFGETPKGGSEFGRR
nr:hypothetical protein [Ralstonia solanacearum]